MTNPQTDSKPDPMTDATRSIRRFVRLTARPQQAAALREAFIELEGPTRREPGCLQFAFFQALTEPDTFALVEEFASQQALDSHLAQPYTQAFFERQLVLAIEPQTLA